MRGSLRGQTGRVLVAYASGRAWQGALAVVHELGDGQTDLDDVDGAVRRPGVPGLGTTLSYLAAPAAPDMKALPGRRPCRGSSDDDRVAHPASTTPE